MINTCICRYLGMFEDPEHELCHIMTLVMSTICHFRKTSMISAQEIYTFKKKMLCSSYEVYKGSSLKMARSRSEKPLMEVNLSPLSKKNMAVFEQSQKTPAVYARRQRFTGKSRYEMATGMS